MPPYYGHRDTALTNRRRTPTNPGLAPLIAVVLLIVALVCLKASADKRRAPKPAAPVVGPKPEMSEHDIEAALIREHKKALDTNRKRRGTHPTGVALWQ